MLFTNLDNWFLEINIFALFAIISWKLYTFRLQLTKQFEHDFLAYISSGETKNKVITSDKIPLSHNNLSSSKPIPRKSEDPVKLMNKINFIKWILPILTLLILLFTMNVSLHYSQRNFFHKQYVDSIPISNFDTPTYSSSGDLLVSVDIFDPLFSSEYEEMRLVFWDKDKLIVDSISQPVILITSSPNKDSIIQKLAWSPDDRHILSLSEGPINKNLLVWSLYQNQVVNSLLIPQDDLTNVDWVNEETIFMRSESLIITWNIKSNQTNTLFDLNLINSPIPYSNDISYLVSISPNKKILAVLSFNTTHHDLMFWDIEGEKEISNFISADFQKIFSISWNPQSTEILSYGLSYRSGQVVNILSVASGKITKEIDDISNSIILVKWSNNPEFFGILAVNTDYGEFQFWNLSNETPTVDRNIKFDNAYAFGFTWHPDKVRAAFFVPSTRSGYKVLNLFDIQLGIIDESYPNLLYQRTLTVIYSLIGFTVLLAIIVYLRFGKSTFRRF